MDKLAFLQGLQEGLKKKLSDPEFSHEVAIPLLDRVFSHNTASTLLGAGVGAGTGLLGTALQQKNTQPKHWLRNAALGGLLGGSGGLALSHLSPETSKAIAEYAIRRPAGRVITNWVDPFNYGENKLERVAKTPLPKLLRSVIKDEPIYLNPGAGAISASFDPEGYSAREALYRKGFSMDVRSKMFKDLFTSNPDGSVAYNPANPYGKKALSNILDVGTGDTSVPEGSVSLENDPVMGHYARTAMGDRGYGYDDTWDFNLHKNEPLWGLSNISRYFLNNISKPVRVRGIAQST